MKKIFLVIFIIIYSLTTTGCEPATYSYKQNYSIDQIERIELRYAKNLEEPSLIKKSDLKKGAAPHFQMNETTVVEVLDNNLIPKFWDDFTGLEFFADWYIVDKPIGYILIIYLTNGNYILNSFTSRGGDEGWYGVTGEFDSNDNYVRSVGSCSRVAYYEKLLSDYFELYEMSDQAKTYLKGIH